MALMACGLLGFTLHTFMSMVENNPGPIPERIIQGKFPRIPKNLTAGTYRLRVKTHVMKQAVLGTISSTEEGVGSSFAVDLSSYGLPEKKYVITAAHCVVIAGSNPADEIKLEVRTSMTKRWVKCKVLIVDKDRDAALLMTEEELPVAFEMDTEAMVGSPVVVGGCPAGTTPSATMGFLTSKDPELGGHVKCTVWQVSVPFFYGNSGGPVIDAESNKVIGILVAGLSDSRGGLIPGVAICIPSIELKHVVSAYIEMKSVPPTQQKAYEPPTAQPLPPPTKVPEPKAEVIPEPH